MQIDGNSFETRIKACAQELGFVHLGITTVEPPKDYSRFLDWTEKGYAGSMWYLTEEKRKQKRQSVQLVFPEAKSVLVAALSYKPKENFHRTDAKFARYGWGEDYHVVLKTKLDELVEWMKKNSLFDFTSRSYVDTGPILEKSLSERAGVGWIGKNTCMIHPKFGSYILLGEILTSLSLASDVPATHHCGTCTKCLDACPTSAFVGPYQMDATKCISYHTIENRDLSIPELIAKNLQGYVAGCDICQEVCPWNHKSPATEIEEMNPGNHTKLTLEQITRLQPSDYDQLFEKTSFRRISLDKLKSNAKTNLKNLK